VSRPKSVGKSSSASFRSQRPAISSKIDHGHANTNAKEQKAEARGNGPRPVRETQHETAQLMMPQHANVLGHVFGGVVLSMMDTTAAVSAIRHARLACVTVSVDRVDFREPIHVGDLVIMKSSVNFVGRTSMEIGVRVETENLLTGVRRHTNSCYLTFVAVDRNGRPVPVPRLKPETPEELRRYEAAKQRRERRLQERTEEGRERKPDSVTQ
jgi:acyl-CoA hydrolase